jgi:hypothetical protein
VKRHESPSWLMWLLGGLVAMGAMLSGRSPRQRHGRVDPKAVAAGYERSDMQPGVVVAGAVGLLLAIGLLLVGVTLLETRMTGLGPTLGRPADLVGGLQAEARPTPPAPELEAEPGQSLEPYMAAEQAKLNSYRWVDRSAGIAAMPIDRAMDVMSQQGLPARQDTSGQDSGSSSPSSASSGRMQEPYP